MRTLILLLAVVGLVACTPTGHVDDTFTVIPDGLKDCKIFRIQSTTGVVLHAMRCPNSAATVETSDKSHSTSIVVDGAEYIRKESQ